MVCSAFGRHRVVVVRLRLRQYTCDAGSPTVLKNFLVVVREATLRRSTSTAMPAATDTGTSRLHGSEDMTPFCVNAPERVILSEAFRFFTKLNPR